jgi:hypothetical protein
MYHQPRGSGRWTRKLDKKIDAAVENLDDKISGATSEVVKLSYLNSAGAAAQEVVDCARGSLHSIDMPMYRPRLPDRRSIMMIPHGSQ